MRRVRVSASIRHRTLMSRPAYKEIELDDEFEPPAEVLRELIFPPRRGARADRSVASPDDESYEYTLIIAKLQNELQEIEK